jgi:transposase
VRARNTAQKVALRARIILGAGQGISNNRLAQQLGVTRPRYHLHFTPTGASWLNRVERWFVEITGKRIRRGTFHSVSELNRAISEYLRENNRHPRPFIWTAPASNIMKKITHCKEALDGHH